MTKNQIFLGMLGAAVVIAGIAGTISNDGSGSVYVKTADGHEYKSSRSGSSGKTIKFNGKEYACGDDAEALVLEHEDGRTTTVSCN